MKHARTTVTGLAAVALLGAVAAYSAFPDGPGGPADGIPAGGSVALDADVPAVRGLDPDLLAALRTAAADARQQGIELRVTSGRRSPAEQQRLLDAAVTRYGSLDLARRYVNTPEKSTHVSGRAADIGPTDADDWLNRHGARYGLCQVYANEMWHFELLTAPGGTCPPQLPDAAG
ncbi:M15 family metallopeptidase [Kitasatospora sp. NA04385]|uniref:M15 family metallopeptidase n=1 Tax=Kitasatospora sp. NA04385 TaxID=2742135 RepID=UPI0015908F6A|nr:M15 family metallopeptidase [Kitasatospora sp. NA04385]QKW19765.1 M15 family metallopeptidase [Kitasatospora sp. NA04385]